MSGPQPNIELSIDELILHGFPAGQRQRIGDALEQELTRLFRERGIPAALTQNSTLPHINGGAFQATQTHPEAVGKQVARAVYSGLTSAQGPVDQQKRTMGSGESAERGTTTREGKMQ